MSRHATTTQATASIGLAGTFIVASFVASYLIRKYRSRWHDIEEEQFGHDTLHSVIAHFHSLIIDINVTTTVEEANKRRTVGYYLKAREAHLQSLVMGTRSFDLLLERRHRELDRIMKYYNERDKSHRTVIVMCDPTTSNMLDEARNRILQPLEYTHDVKTRGAWIPEQNMIPPEDMHVTVAIPWWWHTMREGNAELSQDLCARFRQALVMDFHHAFQIELERIILLGGKTLVALWRTVGERITEDGTVIYDRHGASVDPFVRLRREIVECFTTENIQIGRQPLTYAHKKASSGTLDTALIRKETPAIPKPQPLKERQNTIESKTPGLGQGDGFIHTTLCRLPLDCLSQSDVELANFHRLCREATATLCGHRMVVSKFRFVETTGKGGDSNPCVEPIFDETVEAHRRIIDVQPGGIITTTENVHLPTQVNDRSATIGVLPEYPSRGTTEGLFD